MTLERDPASREPWPVPTAEPRIVLIEDDDSHERVESITWHRVDAQKPDMDLQVLMSFPPESELSTETGWLDADGWHYCESGATPTAAPMWWADMPTGVLCRRFRSERTDEC